MAARTTLRSESRSNQNSTLPVLTMIEAIDGWIREPTSARLDLIREALGAVLEAIGAQGAYLEAEAAPIPPVRVGVGTLGARPSRTRLAGQREVELFIDGGRLLAGRLWLDEGAKSGEADGRRSAAPTAPEQEAIRALELAFDAAWSRAMVHETVERLEALDAATRGIAGVLSLERVLQLICDRVRELAHAEYAALGTADANGVLEGFVTSGISRAEREAIGPLPRGHGLLGLIIREGRSFRITDISADPHSYGFPPNHPMMRSFLGVPITVKGRGVGDLYLTNKRDAAEFSEADQELVEMFALHAGIAIENARLHEQVQRLAVVEERERIGKDLHDGIIQGIYGIALSLEDVPELMDDDPDEARARIERAIEALNLSIRDIRNFIFGLRPELLEQAGLVGGLAALTDEFRVNTIVDVELSVAQGADIDLPAEATVQLLHIAREALSNIARHAGATRARLLLDVEPAEDGDEIVLDISDNGRGFVVGTPRGPGHQGLINMKTRAGSLGGALEVDSEPGAGTRIIVRVPRAGDNPTGG